MKIARLNNPQLIHEFITNPRLYEQLREDFTPEPDDWAPNLSLSIWLAVYDDDGLWGLFAFVPETPVVYRFHPAVHPDRWGDKRNQDAAQLALSWMWEHTEARKIVGKVPVLYPHLLKWGQQIGFKREGIQRASFLRDGELHDQYHMGISRE